MARECGTCSACCRWPSVKSLGKPAGELCRYYKNGCSIYADRPKECAKYNCSWIRGIGGEHDRPDDCHVLIDRRFTKFGRVLVAKALKPGACKSEKGMRVIFRAQNDEGLPCLICSDDDPNVAIGVCGSKTQVKYIESFTNGKPFVWVS